MITKEDRVRAAIADQAAEWLAANAEGLNADESAELAAWLKASPIHVEGFLRAATIARDLREARGAPEYSIEKVVALARTEEAAPVRSLWPRVTGSAGTTPHRWVAATAALAAIAVVGAGVFWTTHTTPPAVPSAGATSTLHFQTGHGEQLTQRLADNTVLHLNTDSAITVRFSATERLVVLASGQAEFEVAHDPARAFRVLGGSAEVIAVGTQFDVRLRENSTEVTVLEGRVAVGLTGLVKPGGVMPSAAPQHVQVSANQMLRVSAAEWPSMPMAVDAQRTTAWLHREIVFDHEPLERVVAEFNRYAPKPIAIATPALGKLEISGAFPTDDSQAFVAFLRSLHSLRVEDTAAEIKVSQQQAQR